MSYKSFSFGLLGIALGAFMTGALQFVVAWNAPSKAPTEGNVAAPINVSDTPQIKEGSLTVSTTPTQPTGLSVNRDVAVGGSVITPTLCLGTDCRSVWPDSASPINSATSIAEIMTVLDNVEGFYEKYWNLDEDSATGETVLYFPPPADSCDADKNEMYACRPEESRTCTDVINRPYEDCGGEGVSCQNINKYSTRTVYCNQASILAKGNASHYANTLIVTSRSLSDAYVTGVIEKNGTGWRTRVYVNQQGITCDSGWVNNTGAYCSANQTYAEVVAPFGAHKVPLIRARGNHYSSYWCSQKAFDTPLVDTYTNKTCSATTW